mmetsp:Transcript_31267/g.50698  ORF Transcript_31267/g.50698 Transcript_31267/m.50698 type:complete len:271 (+) Transcript_31267:71-883(+)
MSSFFLKSRANTEELSQANFTFVIVVGSSSIMWYAQNHDLNFYQAISLIAVLVFSLFWYFVMGEVLFGAQTLDFVFKPKTRKSRNMPGLVMVDSHQQDKKKPITTMSDIIGIRGSNAQKLASCLLSLLSGLLSAAHICKLLDTTNQGTPYDSYLALLAAFSVFMIPTWEINYEEGVSDALHAVAACVLPACGLASYVFQQNFNFTSLSLSVVAGAAGCIFAPFQCLMPIPMLSPFADCVDPFHRSVISITSQCVVMLCASCALMLTTYHL